MTVATTNRYAVFGNPVAHSKSPRIHQLFAKQFGIDIDYQAIEAPLDGFAEAIKSFRDAGGKGCNVTVPFKQEAWQLANTRSGRAELAGAVNTLRFEDDGSVFGENTDGVGLLRDLTLNLDTKLFDQRILVIGAGGAVRGILGPLIEQAPKKLVVAPEGGHGHLRRPLQVHAFGGEEPVVARVVGQRRPQAGGEAVVEEIR